jgi:hypothetical protein
MRAYSFRHPLFAAVVLCAACLCAAPAHAQWPQGAFSTEYPIGRHSMSEFYMTKGPDSTKTWCVTVERAGLGPYNHMFGFTTNAGGTFEAYPNSQVSTASPAGTAPIGQATAGKPWAPGAGGGGFYFYPSPVSGSTVGLYVLRYRPDGSTLSPSARVDSIHTKRSAPWLATLTTPDSGAWCVWRDAQTSAARLVRVDRNATFAPPYKLGGWLVPGMALNSAVSGATLALDGTGGLLIAVTNPTVRVQRIASDTTIATGWPATGLPLSGAASTAIELGPNALVRADGSAFYVVYTDWASTPKHLYVNRFLLTGVRDPSWPAAGLLLPSGTPVLQTLQGTPDHQGGITLTWLEDSLLYAIHLRSDGTPAAGYASGPLVLATPPKPITVAGVATDATIPGVGVCEGHNDGLFVCYVEAGGTVRARWYDGDGNPEPSPALYEVTSPDADLPATSGYTWLFARGAQSDGAGGAYVALERFLSPDPSLVNRHVFAHITQTTVLATPPASAPSRLALAAGPNPSRGAAMVRLSLPRAETAHFALYDITGRVRFTRDVAGVGEHAIALNDAGVLAPGVYLACVTQAREQAAARLVILY